MRRMLIAGLAVCGLAVGTGIFAQLRAADRTRSIEAAFPPQGEFVTVDGRRVHVIVKGSGPDLVLIHGAGGNAQDFTYEFVDHLSERYRVFAVDRPGLGHTERARPSLNDPLTEDAETPVEQARMLAAATRELGAESPIVLGHSYGASVAMAWALEEPASGVVVLSGATMPWPGPLRRYYRVFGSALGGAIGAPLVAAFVSERTVRRSLDDVFEPAPVDPGYYDGAAIPLALRPDSFRANARQVKSLRPNLVEMSKRYPGVMLPVEILHGTEDDTVRADIHAEPLAASVPNANLTLLEGIGHAPHHVTPKPVIEAIDRVASRAGLR